MFDYDVVQFINGESEEKGEYVKTQNNVTTDDDDDDVYLFLDFPLSSSCLCVSSFHLTSA